MEAGQGSVGRVLDYLLDHDDPVTRPQAAAACGLSRPTVFATLQHLEGIGLVHEAGRQSGSLGRSATLFELDADARTLAAVDIGGSNVRVAITDLRGRPVVEVQAPTRRPGGSAIVEQVIELVRTALEAAGPERPPLSQVVVSVPGVVGADGATVYYASNIDQSEAFDFRSPIRAALGAPVLLDNNVNLAALGEQWQGLAQTLDTFVVVAVGAGIGAGIVHEGRLLRGAHGAAGEVAFLPPYGIRRKLDPNAHDAAGGLSLLHDARSSRGWVGAAPTTVAELFARAAAGEAAAVMLVEEECERIAAVIASIAAIIDPETVILTGGVGANDHLTARTGELVAEMSLFPPEVIRSGLGERASLVGAMRLAAQHARKELMQAVTT
jgi:predicted NBD/HSP70 family sugar kinase